MVVVFICTRYESAQRRIPNGRPMRRSLPKTVDSAHASSRPQAISMSGSIRSYFGTSALYKDLEHETEYLISFFTLKVAA